MKNNDPFLPNDVARCKGIVSDGELFEDCENCLRRLAPATVNVFYIEPPVIIAFWCEYLIEDKE